MSIGFCLWSSWFPESTYWLFKKPLQYLCGNPIHTCVVNMTNTMGLWRLKWTTNLYSWTTNLDSVWNKITLIQLICWSVSPVWQLCAFFSLGWLGPNIHIWIHAVYWSIKLWYFTKPLIIVLLFSVLFSHSLSFKIYILLFQTFGFILLGGVQVHALNVTGLIINTAGGIWYSYAKYQQKKRKPRKIVSEAEAHHK